MFARRRFTLLSVACLAGCSAVDAADIVGQTIENTAHEWCRAARNCTLHDIDDVGRVAVVRRGY